MQAKRNSSNLIVPQTQVRLLREELQLLQEPGSYVGEVVKAMGKNKVLVKVGINLAAALYSRLRLLGRIAALALALAYFITQYYCTGRCLRALMHVGPGNFSHDGTFSFVWRAGKPRGQICRGSRQVNRCRRD